ncbi:hypothetical protein BDY19DRAFT_892588 [Irpex rosettiformis]|uniref:Uncharacterized protein n=1 Tax=Irpex rosettiformis TaxID=378272 RepID=A0ACB8U0T7_9APHY|nr:hypothetical protein BDY19DRAFT_892588 [Irpex rosettiformis]
MATLNDRPFSKDYSGLINQSVIAVVIFAICITSHECMKRKRRGLHAQEGLGSVESWEFGYLFQGRSWAKRPAPPISQGWPLSWVRQVISFPLDKFNELRGVDASLYVRFLKGCVIFTLTHTLTTFPILFPIHIHFSGDDVSPKSMTRASISSLVGTTTGVSLLWIHLVLLIWITCTWLGTLWFICRDTFRYRAQRLQESVDRAASDAEAEKEAQYHPHPHPQYPFQPLPSLDHDNSTRGIRTRTVMVTNIPPGLRSEGELKEYFEYYLSRSIAKPTFGVTSASAPGLFDRILAFIYNRGTELVSRVYKAPVKPVEDTPLGQDVNEQETAGTPRIERVVLVRKMSDLASLLERREDVLRLLETAHIKLVHNVLEAVKEATLPHMKRTILKTAASRMSFGVIARGSLSAASDVERDANNEEGGDDTGEERMDLLKRTLLPFINSPNEPKDRGAFTRFIMRRALRVSTVEPRMGAKQKTDSAPQQYDTIWNALLSLPRSTLDAYQPLIHLSTLFRGKTVPAIDYYTAKLTLLTSLITEKRSQPITDYSPLSTAFVTFANPVDARRACKYLAGHPNNPLNACLVTMAPSYEDLDWIRLMKTTFRVEFVKDWVVNIGVWAFTIFWVFPVTSIVGLVSIQNISNFWPGLKHYLDHHEWESEVIQSFVPTLLTAILTLLIPPLLLLIAKKAHTILTLSALHDKIMTRYYKFLIVNVLVFFCVGTAALQSFLVSFKSTSGEKLLEDISDSFPTAGPFYVGWLIFTMAMHGGIELALCISFQLPLIMYPSTKRQVTPRKRSVGIRPRTFNYYYWLPNHLLVVHILLLFAVLNPLVIPFGFLYFCIEFAVVKNQLLHVYARNYEGNGHALLVRLVRYSIDGMYFAHLLAIAVFLAYMVVLKRKANFAVAAALIFFTILAKLSLTRFCRAQFERDDLIEAKILSGSNAPDGVPIYAEELSTTPVDENQDGTNMNDHEKQMSHSRLNYLTWKLSSTVGFSYGPAFPRKHTHHHRQPIPFVSRSSAESGEPLRPSSSRISLLNKSASDVKRNTPIPCRETIREVSSEPIDERPSYDLNDRHALVSPHPCHPVWDDEPNLDTPYDNPYYTRPISDTLWLPRDPMGILNLDDTVDVRMSLTSEPGAGRLGAWAEEEFIGSALSSVFAPSFSSMDDDTSSVRPSTAQLDGTETINLPAGIASRMNSIDRELMTETVTPPRPFLMKSRTSSSSVRRPVVLRSASTPHESPSHTSPPSRLGASVPRPDPSYLTLPSPRSRHRGPSFSALGIGFPSEIPIQRVPTSAISFRSRMASINSLRSPGIASIISTRDAVVGEAIAEEQEVVAEQSRKEEVAQEKEKESRSWLISWMYSSVR